MSADGAVVVTGAGGFVGRHVVAALRRRDVPVVPVEHRWDDVEEVLADVQPHRPVSCIHLGWYADPKDYLTAVPPNARSLHDTLTLVRGLDRIGVARVVVAGTSAEYAAADHPLAEEAPLAPRSVYGSAKALCHALLRDVEQPHAALCWARLFNVVGPGEREGRILPSVARALLAGQPVDLSAGTQLRDYVDVRDVGRAFADLATCEPARLPEAVNVGTGVATALRDVLLQMAAVTGGADLLRFGARPFLREDAPAVVADASRLRQEVGWEPELNVAQIVQDIVADWRNYDGRGGSAASAGAESGSGSTA